MNTNLNKSWIDVPAQSDFPLQNIPFGIITSDKLSPRVATIIGNTVIDIAALNSLGYLKGLNIPKHVLESQSLNKFIALGKSVTTKVREQLMQLFSVNNTELKNNAEHKNNVLIDAANVQNLLPVEVGDYTDFYSSMEHATNVGKMFRDPANALLPNWKHLPVGYHGRASSIFVSGTPFHRPKGQSKAPDAELPTFGPTKLLDFELEMAFIIGKENKLGESISTEKAEEYIFGMVLFNDWSARDIQAWEYVPLGPFLAKNFFSSVSPWVVTLEALEPFRVQGPVQEPKVLPYLEYSGAKNYDIQLDVFIQPENGEENKVCRSNFKYMYWNMCQQLAHHTINGCNVRIGDMMASGTISGPTEDSFGSMLELTWRGTKPIKLKDGSERKFINDFDTVIIRGYADKEGLRIGFGEVKNKALPAL
ncbi:MAG: fumarylacetoacetase [Bacteroidia bacterium]